MAVRGTVVGHGSPSSHTPPLATDLSARSRHNCGLVSRDRVAVRDLLLDPDSRVLLFEERDLSDVSDTARWWFTAGGGIEQGETFAEAAEREVREETGHIGLEFVGPFHRREFVFTNHGDPQQQIEHFFAARTGDIRVSAEGWTDLERRAVTSSRWWTAAELEAGSVSYFPVNLVALMHQAAVLV